MKTKDPYRTVERLTNALELVATFEASASERAKEALIILQPLQIHEFPTATAAEYFKIIQNNSKAILDNDASPETVRLVLKSIWDLYWEMSENARYR